MMISQVAPIARSGVFSPRQPNALSLETRLSGAGFGVFEVVFSVVGPAEEFEVVEHSIDAPVERVPAPHFGDGSALAAGDCGARVLLARARLLVGLNGGSVRAGAPGCVGSAGWTTVLLGSVRRCLLTVRSRTR
jgi:hypothetical protein